MARYRVTAFIALLFLLIGQPLAAQPYPTDPRQFDVFWLYTCLEGEREDLVRERVQQVRSYGTLARTCRNLRRSRLEYTVTYNAEGDPVHVRSFHGASRPKRKWPLTLAPYRRSNCGVIELRLTYVAPGQLQSVVTTSYHDGYSLTEESLHFTHDSLERPATRTMTRTTRYRPGFRYRGVAYPDHTERTHHSVTHDPSGTAHVILLQEDDEHFTTDTLSYPYSPDRSTADRMIQSNRLDTLDGPVTAGVFSLRDIRYQGRLIHRETIDPRSGHVHSRLTFVPRNNGLLDHVEQDGNCVRVLEYDLFPSPEN